MSDQMPMFDDPIPPAEPNPKKPRQKPVRRRKAVKAEAPKPVKKRRKKRVAKKKDFVIPITKKSLRGMSPIEFLEVVAGITMAPWQRRVIAAYLEKDQ